MIDMHEALRVLRMARKALLDVPSVGETYDEERAETHISAVTQIEYALMCAGWPL